MYTGSDMTLFEQAKKRAALEAARLNIFLLCRFALECEAVAYAAVCIRLIAA